jgi:hypothetical protein
MTKLEPSKKVATRSAQKQRPQHAIDNEKPLEGLCSEEVSQLVLKLIAHGLQHEGEEDNHPQPISAAEARAIEQGEGCEEGTHRT